MIRVTPALEPDDFDSKVRQKGLSALAEMVGEPPSVTRRGRKRVKKIWGRRDDIPASEFPPFWTKALDDLLTAYDRLCAYTALYIHHATGAPSVDHLVPKSRHWDKAYEWTNYRLACSLVNTKKGVQDVLDPFEIQDDWFELELVGFQVRAGPDVARGIREQVDKTIIDLGLNRFDCRKAREDYAENYWSANISLAYLEQRAPFVARELRRQGRLLACDGA